jgi:hypothetical protein
MHYLCRLFQERRISSLRNSLERTVCGTNEIGVMRASHNRPPRQRKYSQTGCGGLAPSNLTDLRRPGESQVEARSSDSVEFLVETRDFAGLRAVLL